MNEDRYPFEDMDEIRFAPDDQIGEWEEEIERWLPEAVGYSVYDVLITDDSHLDDFMDTEPTGKIDEWGYTIVRFTVESWERARAALSRYDVEIGPREESHRSDTNLVSLAKRTLDRPREGN